MSMPEVVVACAWYNRAEYIRVTVDSLLNQDFDSFEIIIVNDGSTDPRVKEILDSYNDPRLRVIHQANTGFTVAIRRAIDASNAPHIAIQGAGDVSHSSRLGIQFEYLKQNPEVALVGSGSETYSIQQSRSITFLDKELLNIDQKYLKKRVPFTQGTIMFRRSAYEEIGGYDLFFKYCQDWDLYYRMSKVGKIARLGAALYSKRIFNDGASYAPEKHLEQRIYRIIASRTNYELKEQIERNPLKLKQLAHPSRMLNILVASKTIAKLVLIGETRLAKQWALHVLRR